MKHSLHTKSEQIKYKTRIPSHITLDWLCLYARLTQPNEEVFNTDLSKSHCTTGCFDDRLLTMMTDKGFYVP